MVLVDMFIELFEYLNCSTIFELGLDPRNH